MRIVGATATLWLMLVGSSDPLADPYVYGFGNTSCVNYLNFKSQNNDLYEAAKTWTTGYLTAMGQQLRIEDLLAGTDMNGAARWLDDYCAQNPGDRFVVANHELVMFLVRRSLKATDSR
jgi:hypothetical protein